MRWPAQLTRSETEPKAMRAVMRHNLDWFGHYIFGDPLPDFTTPEVPKAK